MKETSATRKIVRLWDETAFNRPSIHAACSARHAAFSAVMHERLFALMKVRRTRRDMAIHIDTDRGRG